MKIWNDLNQNKKEIKEYRNLSESFWANSLEILQINFTR